jgi:hypothetical protein
MDSTERAKLRVGLLIDSFSQPQWIYKIIQDINQSSIAEVVLVIKNVLDYNGNRRGSFRRMTDERKNLIQKLYVQLDDFIFKSNPDPFKRTNITALTGDCPVIQVGPQRTKYSDSFQKDDLSQMLDYQLDVAFRFGFRILKGDVLGIAKYGIWSLHHGDNLVNRGGPAGFWEVMHGEPVTGSILQILTPACESGKVIYRSWASTYKFSVRKNKQGYYWKSANFPMRKLRELYENGPQALESDPYGTIYYPYSHERYKTPANAEMACLLTKLIIRIGRRVFQQLLYQRQWLLAYKIGQSDQIATSFDDFKRIVPPKDRFWADPFPVKAGGKYFLFVEEFVYKEGKGYISVIEMDGDGKWNPSVKVLEREYHLAYPFVFEWRGSYYMIPETSANRTIELYRSTAFPFKWKFEKVLIDNIKAVDATLAEIDGHWWMFSNVYTDGASSNDELWVFYADSPLGPWKPHKRNPVKSDVRCSRPAGRLFYWNGELYRPAQDSSHAYGYAIVINRIKRLSACDFLEEEVAKIVPKWHRSISRTHTLNHWGDFTVIDGLRSRRRLC